MSLCSPCAPIKVLPDCITNLVVGTMPAINTAFYVYIKDITTDRTERYSATSSALGLLIIVVTQSFSPAHAYEIWATTLAGSIDDKVAIIIPGIVGTVDCAALKFESSYTAGTKNTFTTVTITGV